VTHDWSAWGMPLVVAAIGLVGGLFVSRRVLGTDEEHSRTLADGRREDLLRTKDSTLEALRALEMEREKLDPADYEEQRRVLLARGSGALQALDAEKPAAAPRHAGTADARALLEAQRAVLGDAAVDAALAALDKAQGASVAPPAPPAAAPAVSPAWQGAGWAIGAVLVGFGLWYLAGGESVERREGASMTGNQDLGGGSGGPTEAAAAPFPGQEELEARLAANPNDIDALVELTEASIGAQDLGQAMAYNSRVRQIDPTNKDGRVHFAFLKVVIGQFDSAIADLDAVIAEDPKHGKALAYKGLFLIRAGRPAEAIAPLEAAIASGAPGRPALEEELRRAKAMASGEMPMPSETAPADHPPAPAPASGGDMLAAGTITITPEAQARLGGSEIVYVSLRDPSGGPPVAALRLPPGPFPLSFEVTTANVIAMGGARPVPPVLDLSVRIDTDGNPMTRSDAEPSFTQKAVSTGTGGLEARLN